jgi:hypothetical protein
MSDALGLRLPIKWMGRDEVDRVIPEPEFAPFAFHTPVKKVTARAKAAASANTASASHTLAELGVPNSLASEMEFVLGLLGSTKGNAVVGYTFITPDGSSHALRLTEAERFEKKNDKAA